MEKIVDVAIQIHGKPFQSAVTLLSLVRHCERWISKIFVSIDRRQPERFDMRALLKDIRVPIRWHRPRFWLGIGQLRPSWRLRFRPYRRSIRYQLAWETTRQPYLFVTHNDMLYRGDLIGAYLDQIGNAIGIGSVGQCWNCEANYAGLCTPDRFHVHRPSQQEYLQMLAGTRPGPRRNRYPDMNGVDPVWPLPECRLNEFAALISMRRALPLSYPLGPVLPFGAPFGLDVGSDWFRHMCELGEEIRHFDFGSMATHGWTADGHGGNVLASDTGRYQKAEQMAHDLLRKDFGWQ